MNCGNAATNCGNGATNCGNIRVNHSLRVKNKRRRFCPSGQRRVSSIIGPEYYRHVRPTSFGPPRRSSVHTPLQPAGRMGRRRRAALRGEADRQTARTDNRPEPPRFRPRRTARARPAPRPRKRGHRQDRLCSAGRRLLRLPGPLPQLRDARTRTPAPDHRSSDRDVP